MMFYNQEKSRPLPEIVHASRTRTEVYHPRGTEASEETLRW